MSNLSVLAFDEAPRGHGGRGATEQIARLLDSSEIDAPASLYDEALTLAKEVRFAPATDRLRMLLTLDPIDSEAALLLGKVLAARGQWQEALQRLDAAQANGAAVPTTLRERVENALRNQIQDAEEQRLRLAARERTEIRNTRAEAKRLRSANAVLDAQVQALYSASNSGQRHRAGQRLCSSTPLGGDRLRWTADCNRLDRRSGPRLHRRD